MQKTLLLFVLMAISCFGCSFSPTSLVTIPTHTPEKTLVIPTEKSTIQPTLLSPCDNRAINSTITPLYQNSRIHEISLNAGRIAFSSDSKKVFLNTPKGIYALNASDAQLICVIPKSGYGMIVSQKGDLLAYTDIYGKVTLMNANSGIIIRELQATLYQSQSLNWIEFNNDGSLLVSSGYFQPVTVWDTKSGQIILETIGDHAAISPDGRLLAIRGSNYIQIIDTQYKVALITKVDDKKEPHFLYLLFSQNGNYLYGLNVYSEIKVWDVHTGEIVQTINPYTINPCLDGPCVGWEVESPRLTLSADGSKLLLVDPSQIILWNTQTWEKIMSESSFDRHPLSDASISPDGKKIIVTFQDEEPIRFFYLDQ